MSRRVKAARWLAVFAAVVVGVFIAPQAANAATPNCSDAGGTFALGWTTAHEDFEGLGQTFIETTGSVKCNIVAWSLHDVNTVDTMKKVFAEFYTSDGGTEASNVHWMTLGSSTHVTIATDVLPHTRVALVMWDAFGVNECANGGQPYFCTIAWNW